MKTSQRRNSHTHTLAPGICSRRHHSCAGWSVYTENDIWKILFSRFYFLSAFTIASWKFENCRYARFCVFFSFLFSVCVHTHFYFVSLVYL
jgi:hypothetical protein